VFLVLNQEAFELLPISSTLEHHDHAQLVARIYLCCIVGDVGMSEIFFSFNLFNLQNQS